MKDPGVIADRELWMWRNNLWLPLVVGILLASTAAIRYRQSESMPIIPLQAYYFTLISLVIGFSEEILFRGFIQGESEMWHPAGAIILSAFFFAAYKALLFVFPRPENHTNPLVMFPVTLLAGLLLGFLRHRSRSLWPCIVAHGLFDLLGVYGYAFRSLVGVVITIYSFRSY